MANDPKRKAPADVKRAQLAGSLEVPADDLLRGSRLAPGDVRIGRFLDRSNGEGRG